MRHRLSLDRPQIVVDDAAARLALSASVPGLRCRQRDTGRVWKFRGPQPAIAALGVVGTFGELARLYFGMYEPNGTQDGHRAWAIIGDSDNGILRHNASRYQIDCVNSDGDDECHTTNDPADPWDGNWIEIVDFAPTQVYPATQGELDALVSVRGRAGFTSADGDYSRDAGAPLAPWYSWTRTSGGATIVMDGEGWVVKVGASVVHTVAYADGPWPWLGTPLSATAAVTRNDNVAGNWI